MTTVEAVKTWQQIVGVPVDGLFGPVTRTATIEWQRKRMLAADGIVGPLTWLSAGLTAMPTIKSGSGALTPAAPVPAAPTTSAFPDMPVIPERPANYARVVVGITPQTTRPSQEEFDKLDLADVEWKTSQDWAAFSRAYNNANLPELAKRLGDKANAVSKINNDLRKLAASGWGIALTRDQWSALADKAALIGDNTTSAKLRDIAAGAQVASIPAVQSINPINVYEIEYTYLMSLPDGAKTKAELQEAGNRLRSAGYDRWGGALHSKSMYFDIMQSEPKPSWWTDPKANPDYKPAQVFAKEQFAQPVVEKYAPEPRPFKEETMPTFAPSNIKDILLLEPKIEVTKPAPPDAIPLNQQLAAAMIKAKAMKSSSWWKRLLRL